MLEKKTASSLPSFALRQHIHGTARVSRGMSRDRTRSSSA
jgi:hypothetical protein